MMGHKLPGPEDAYSRPTVEMLKEAYKKAMAALSITETAEQRTRVEMLEAQVQNLLLNGQRKDTKIQKLENKITSTTVLEARINKLEELLMKDKREKPNLP
jgi:hypothetical protein